MNHQRKMLFAAIGLVLAAALMGAFVIWPNYRTATIVKKQVYELNARIARFGRQTDEKNVLESELGQAENRVNHELKTIPETPDVAALIRKFSQHVDRVRVLDQTFTAGTTGDALIGSKSTVQAMPLTVDMHATFDSVFALVQNAESIDRLVRVSSIRVACKRDEKLPLEADLTIVKASILLESIFDPTTTLTASANAASAGGDS